MTIFRFIFFTLTILLLSLALINIDYNERQSFNNLIINTVNQNSFDGIEISYIENKILEIINSNEESKDINIPLLEDLIIDNNYIKKAEVYLDANDDLNVDISFRVPVVKLVDQGRVYYLDSDGVKLPKLKTPTENTLVLTGMNGSKRLTELGNMINEMKENKYLTDIFGGVHFVSENLFLLSSKICDLGIIINNNFLFDSNKLKQLEMFLIYMSEKVGCDYCEEIDLRFDNQIICIN